MRGANAAAVDANSATRNAIFAYVSQSQPRPLGMLSEEYPRGAIREHKSSN